MNLFKNFNLFRKKPQVVDIEPEITEELLENDILENDINDQIDFESVENENFETVVLEETNSEIEEIQNDVLSQETNEETYINEEIPSEEEEKVIERRRYEPIFKLEPHSTDLTKFLEHKWSDEGQRDGYYVHSSDFLRKRKNSLITEFQRLVEKRVDELKQERLISKLMLIDLKESSSNISEKINLRIELCNDYIEDLHNEKNISNSNNGLIRGVLTQYEIGFDQGMSDYLSDTIFLNPLKRL